MKTLGFSHLMLWTLTACAFVSGKTQAQSVLYSFDQIEAEWQKVYPSNSPVLKTVFTKYIDNGALFSDDAGTSAAASPGSVFGGIPGKPEIKLRFPIKTFDAESSEAFLAGQARIQLLKNTLKYYVGAREDSYRAIAEFDRLNPISKLGENPTEQAIKEFEQKRNQALDDIYNRRRSSIDSMKKAVDVELFAAQMANYAVSSSLNQRCNFWREAKNMAIELQFDSAEPVFAPELKAFADFYRQVRSFYASSNGFSRIPPELCSLSVVNSRGDTVNAIQEAIDAAIIKQMHDAEQNFQDIIQKRQQELGQLMSQSEIKMPSRGLFALEKGFNDAFDLMNMVQSDLLGLYKGGDSTLMGQLKKQIEQMNTKDAETNARQNINTFVLLYGKLLSKLASMPDAEGLKPASKANLEICRVLRSIPGETSSAGDLANFQSSYNSCLKALVVEYKAGRQSKKDDPTTLKFAESLSSLVSFYKTKM